uniref:Sosondowah ankyrin repeat domain family member A n=1 Tax=Cairina moschata TaxID=8855 RepID=A0A8C3CE94_CAIMO
MAELALSPAAVLGFLRERGGRVRNAELLGAFRPLLEAAGDAAERAERRELFKRSVNAVATVKERDGAKFVVLKRHLRPPPPPGGVPMDGGGTPPQGRLSPAPPEELRSPPEELRSPPEEQPSPPEALQSPPEEQPSPPEALQSLLEEQPSPPEALRLPPEALKSPPDVLPSPPEEQPSPPEEQPSPRAVSELRGIFQRSGGGGVPLPAGGSGSRREPVPKPCMLPVRCVPSPAAAPEQPKEPGATLSPLPEEDEAGCRSPNLRRVPKTLRASEEPAAVPLEEAEHRWLVMAAEGQWSQQLHGLLLGDASLAARRDFISGFTALHWAAKNGNCDMVRNIIEVAQKEGTHVDVDARSHGGYTALHLAAMHGQETVISMLVRSYHAKTDLRDYSGKKPHQCLREGASIAVRRLLGDPSLEITGGSSLPMKKSTKIAASILSSTSTFLGVISDDMAFYDLTKGLRKPSSLNKLLAATTGPRRKPKTRGSFPSYLRILHCEQQPGSRLLEHGLLPSRLALEERCIVF